MIKPMLLDCFCGAGGCSRGYQQAGFYVVGIDINPQKHYIGDDFLQMDALEALRILIGGGCIVGKTGLEYWLGDFAVIHASPPCQFGSEATPVAARANYENLIPATRELLKQVGLPYVIENVEAVRSWLINPIMLCGSMFGLTIWRHRYFEIYPYWTLAPYTCKHLGRPISLHPGSNARRGRDNPIPSIVESRQALEISWMNSDELFQAIPPAYTQWIGAQLLESLVGVI